MKTKMENKGEKSLNNNFEDRTLDLYTSLKYIFNDNDFVKEKKILIFIASLLLFFWVISLWITIMYNNLWNLNDWNIALFIFFSTISGTIFFINYITNKNRTISKNIDSENEILNILYDYLESKECTPKNDYSDKQKEVWFKDKKRIFEFIYRINYVQIAVSQDENFKTLMWNLANKIWVTLDTFWTSYYLVKIPYNKLDEKLVEDIKKIIDETLK